MRAQPERKDSWLSIEWDKPNRPSAVHGFLDQITGHLLGDKRLVRSGEREWRKAAEYRNAAKSGTRSSRPSAPNGGRADGSIFGSLFGGRKLVGAARPEPPPRTSQAPRRSATTRDRPSGHHHSSSSARRDRDYYRDRDERAYRTSGDRPAPPRRSATTRSADNGGRHRDRDRYERR